MEKEELTLVKVGGKIVEDPSSLSALLDRFVALPGRKMLVHGGGRTATDIASRLGIATQMVGGRRVTDAAMLEVVTMVYGGLVNKRVVAALQGRGLCALGLTGADLDVIRSRRRSAQPVDYGFVGDPERVDGARLAALVESKAVPVLAPLTHDGMGHLLNTNADTIASSAAIALSAHYRVTLMYCFEHAGVLRDPADPASVIARITPASFATLEAEGVVSGGMLPKLQNCFAALQAGVRRVVITSAEALSAHSGTVIEPHE